MAYFQHETRIDVPAATAWEALKDVGHLHTRLVRDFVVACRFDGQTRQLTFANGVSTSERIIAIGEQAMRVSWSAASERLVHHNASAQVIALTSQSCRVVWVVDLLPDTMAPAIEAMVKDGLQAMKRTLESPGTA